MIQYAHLGKSSAMVTFGKCNRHLGLNVAARRCCALGEGLLYTVIQVDRVSAVLPTVLRYTTLSMETGEKSDLRSCSPTVPIGSPGATAAGSMGVLLQEHSTACEFFNALIWLLAGMQYRPGAHIPLVGATASAHAQRGQNGSARRVRQHALDGVNSVQSVGPAFTHYARLQVPIGALAGAIFAHGVLGVVARHDLVLPSRAGSALLAVLGPLLVCARKCLVETSGA